MKWKISQLVENNKTETHIEKRNKNEEYRRYMGHYKRSNMNEGKERNNWAEATFEYIVVDNILKLKH